MQRGSFVVLCGGEGSGKSTLIERTKAECAGKNLLFTREPGGSPRAEEIRKYVLRDAPDLHPEAQFDLMFGARKDHCHKIIAPAIFSGVNVLCDRFDCCTYAYQIWGSQMHELKMLFSIQRDAVLRIVPAPTYIWLNLDPVLGLMRKKGVSDRNHFDDKKLDFHKRVHQGYGDFTGIGRVIELDASLPKDELWHNFKQVLDRLIA